MDIRELVKRLEDIETQARDKRQYELEDSVGRLIEDLIEEDMAHFRIEFSTPDGKDIALCDFTYYDGYNPLIESNIDNLTDEELDKAIKGMAEV